MPRTKQFFTVQRSGGYERVWCWQLDDPRSPSHMEMAAVLLFIMHAWHGAGFWFNSYDALWMIPPRWERWLLWPGAV